MTSIWIVGILVLAAVGLSALGAGKVLAWLGGGLMAVLALGLAWDRARPAWKRFLDARKRRRDLHAIDWQALDQAGNLKDCEIPGSGGECTGIDCYVYFTCNYAKKRPLPK